MVNKAELAPRVVLAVFLLLFGVPPSIASLLGSEVSCVTPTFTCTPTTAIVGDGVEFELIDQPDEDLFLTGWEVDISGEHVRWTYVLTGHFSLSTTIKLTLSDLQWIISPSGEMVEFENLEVKKFSTSGVKGMEITDVALSAGTITLDYSNTSWSPGSDTYVEFDLVVRPTRYVDSTSLSSPNGGSYDAVAVLRTLTIKPQPQVLIKDSGTNETINFVAFFWPDWMPIAVASIDANNDGIDDIAVLAANKNNGKIKVQVRDAITDDRITQMEFLTPEWTPQDLTVLDGNGDGKKDLAVLAVNTATEEVVTIIKDVSTKDTITKVPFPNGQL